MSARDELMDKLTYDVRHDSEEWQGIVSLLDTHRAEAQREMEGDCIRLSEDLDEAKRLIQELQRDLRDARHWESVADRMRAALADRPTREEVLREAADAVANAFYHEPFLSYPPDFAELLHRMAAEAAP